MTEREVVSVTLGYWEFRALRLAARTAQKWQDRRNKKKHYVPMVGHVHVGNLTVARLGAAAKAIDEACERRWPGRMAEDDAVARRAVEKAERMLSGADDA